MSQMNRAARRQLIQERVAEEVKGAHREEQLPWQDKQQSFPVVRLPLSAVLLSPFSHRIKSQLQSHPEQDTVESDPFSEQSQRILADLLRDTGQFEALKKNLQEDGQIDPGVVTRDGVLVNANRRATALRDLGESYVEVAVLPGGATPQEIAELELALQVREDYKEEYSFTNTLLFVKDLVDQGYTADRIALMLNLAASSDSKELKKGRAAIDSQLRMLAMIREVQAIAEQDGGKRLPLTFFDGKRQSLLEIDDAYETKKQKDPARADLLKRMRLVGLLADAGYGPLRQMNEDFFPEYLLPALDEIAGDDGFEGDLTLLVTESEEGEQDEDPSLALLGDDQTPPADTVSPDRLLRFLATTHGEEEVEIPRREGEDNIRVGREAVVDQITSAIKLAAGEHKEEQSLQKRVEAPAKKADTARRNLDQIGKKLEKVYNRPDFDWDHFDEAISKLRRSYDALLGTIAKRRSDEHSGESATGGGG